MAGRWILLVVGVMALSAGSALAQQTELVQTMLVHLPSAPVEAANRQASAITTLADYLSERLPDHTIEAKIFRRWRDASQFLSQQPESVALMLADAAFVVDTSIGLQPAYRFVRAGRGTYRRLLVVREDRQELIKLVDLRDKSLAIVEAAGVGDVAFLRQQIFEDELDPATWFAALQPAADDFSATASVLYGQIDAALIAEYNPLLTSHLGKDLRAVFASPELSLPVLSIRESAFTPAAQQALQEAIRALSDDSIGMTLLASLGIDGLAPLDGGGPPTGSSKRRQKVFAIATPAGDEFEISAPPLPAPSELTFAVTVELPDIPLPVDEEGGLR